MIFQLIWQLLKSKRMYSIAIILYFIIKIRKPKLLKQKTITINSNVLLWNPSPNPAKPTIAFKESTIEFIVLLLKHDWIITIISIVKSDEQQETILRLLQDLRKYGLDMDRVLFCEQSASVSTIVRHINPCVHMDSNLDIIKKTSQFVHCYLVHQKHVITQTQKIATQVKGLTRTVSTKELIPQPVKLEKEILLEEIPNVTRLNSLSDCNFFNE